MARRSFAPGVVVTITQVSCGGGIVRTERIRWGGETVTSDVLAKVSFDALVSTVRDWFRIRGRI